MKKVVALIVEDSEILADYFSEVLQAAGYQTVTASDGRMAQKLLQKLIPDMILLDLNLPHVSGEELLNFIRSDRRFIDTHIFITSANGTQASQIGENADLVLQKPIEFNQLKVLSRKFHPHYNSRLSSFSFSQA